MINLQQFAYPSAEYRLHPFWFWNSRIDETEMLSQLRDFSDKGVGGVIISGRFGLETPYMSAQWFALLRRCCQEARTLNMHIWLYDDADFPSGVAVHQHDFHPEYLPQYIRPHSLTLKNGNNAIPVSQNILAAAICQNTLWQPADIIHDGLILLEAAEGMQAVTFERESMTSANQAFFGVNYLNPDMTRAFLACTHEVYKRELGEFFGNTIKGFFTDEPTLLPWHQEGDWYIRGDGRVIPWDDHLAARLAAKLGTGFESRLLTALFYDIEDAAALRQIYYSEVSALYIEAFFRPYAKWCHENGLELTGHLLLEEGMYFNTIFQGNALEALMELGIPGSDMLTNRAEENDMAFMVGDAAHMPKMRTNVTGQKLVSSAAHLAGRTRVMTETFGVGGWQMNMRDMRWIAAWQYALGINMMVPHAFFYSIEGFRKTDAPPSHWHSPAWPQYRQFADLIGRLSYALSQGEPCAELAVLYPANAFRSVYRAGQQHSADQYISDVFDLICATLPKVHVEYDIVPESHIDETNITENGYLRIGTRQYKSLILPSALTLPETVAQAASAMKQRGGAVLLFEAYPAHGEDSTYVQADTVPPTVLNGDVGLLGMRQVLERFLGNNNLRNVRLQGEGASLIYVLSRKSHDETLWYFANTSRDVALVEIDIPIPEMDSTVVVYDAETGEAWPWSGLQHRFEGGESLLLGVRSSEAAPIYAAHVPLPELHAAPMPLTGWRFEPEGDNVCPLTQFRFEIDRSATNTKYIYITQFMADAGLINGITKNALWLMLDDVAYRTAKMGRQQLTVMLNGQPVTPDMSPDARRLDPGHIKYACGHLVQAGLNRVSLTFTHSPWSGPPHILQQPVSIMGAFRLGRVDDVHTLFAQQPLCDLKGWEQLGYPYYSGVGRYSRELSVRQMPRRVFLGFSKELLNWYKNTEPVADTLRVLVNGTLAGSRVWEPWRVEITSLLVVGNNQITLEVSNSLHNMLEGQPRPSGILATPTLFFES